MTCLQPSEWPRIRHLFSFSNHELCILFHREQWRNIFSKDWILRRDRFRSDQAICSHLARVPPHISRKRSYGKIQFTTIAVIYLITCKTHGGSGSLNPMRKEFPRSEHHADREQVGEELVPWPLFLFSPARRVVEARKDSKFFCCSLIKSRSPMKRK